MVSSQKLVEALRESVKQNEQLRQTLQKQEQSSREPIAILGISCRIPGLKQTPEAYWELLRNGKQGQTSVLHRWPASVDAEEGKLLPTAPQAGLILAEKRGDSSFFGLSTREATGMTPDQFMMLELTWEALETAGIVPSALEGHAGGVFLGFTGPDPCQETISLKELKGYTYLNISPSAYAGRVAYHLGLTGPALTVDTACSSSLVSIHLAMQSLRQNECSLALAGGIYNIYSPGGLRDFQKLGVSSPDGRCHSFSADANGIGWSEGGGILVLKRLSDAQRDGDSILAVIRGSAVNQDGRSQGLAVPHGPSQRRVIRQALQNSGLTSHDIDAIEAHGSGTALGDPIEANALLEVFGSRQERNRPLWLGSSKSNLGHAQSAAGVLGVIKMVLSLYHEELPQTLHAQLPNPLIDWDKGSLQLLQIPQPWKRESSRPRRAGVSSFGVTGTNAHLILEEAPLSTPPEPSTEQPLPLLLSGKTDTALEQQAQQWLTWLKEHPQVDWTGVIRTAATARTHHPYRASIGNASSTEIQEALQALSTGDSHPWLYKSLFAQSRGCVFVLSGHGSQWAGMGKELLQESEVFRASLEASDKALQPWTGWSLLSVFQQEPDSPDWERVDVVQPVLFAMGLALTALWKSLGVHPTAVLGHSVGEVAAAVVAGILPLEQAARLVAIRGQLIAQVSEDGGMLHVHLPSSQVSARCRDLSLSIAVVNTEDSCVVSGNHDELETFKAELTQEGIFARRVRVGFAAHSSHMDSILEEFHQRLQFLTPQKATLPFYSTITAAPVQGVEMTAEYWCRNLRETVQFSKTLQRIREQQSNTFLEVGGHPVLSQAIQDIRAEQPSPLYAASLFREQGGLHTLLQQLGVLHCQGVLVDWKQHFPSSLPHLPWLPTYPFQRDKYGQPSSYFPGQELEHYQTTRSHAFLRSFVPIAGTQQKILTGYLSPQKHHWLLEHSVAGRPVLPGAAVLEMVLYAAREWGYNSILSLQQHIPLVIPERGALRLQFQLFSQESSNTATLHFYFQELETKTLTEWQLCAEGQVGTSSSKPEQGRLPQEAFEQGDLVPQQLSGGVDYGPSFRGVRFCKVREQQCWCKVELPFPSLLANGQFLFHPVLLDAALHGILTFIAFGELSETELLVPFFWEGVSFYQTPQEECWSCLTLQSSTSEELVVSVQLFTGAGVPVLEVERLHFRNVSSDSFFQDQPSDCLLQTLHWEPWETPSLSLDPFSNLAILSATATSRLSLPAKTYTCVTDFLSALSTYSPPALLCIDFSSFLEDTETALEPTLAGVNKLVAELQLLLQSPESEALRICCITSSALSVRSNDCLRSPFAAMLWGLVRSLRKEFPRHNLHLVDVERKTLLSAEMLSTNLAESAWRGGTCYRPTLQSLSEEPQVTEDSLLELLSGQNNGLESIHVTHSSLLPPRLERNHVEVRVYASGINFRDILKALDITPEEETLVEFAGIVTQTGSSNPAFCRGQRVFGFCMGHVQNILQVDEEQCFPMPDGMSVAQAATLPVAFSTALYGLQELGELQAGERVLIHAGTGGVGMAAMQVARSIGAEIFVTASPHKWPALRALGIPDSHIASSRTLEFSEKFLQVTEGQGMDVILNSLAGDFIDASLRLLPRGGRFLEMGKTDIRDREWLQQHHPAVCYHSLDLLKLPPFRRKELMHQVLEGVKQGIFTPLPVRGFDVREAAEAFQYMAQARHVGKVVLQLPAPFQQDGTYLITGGLGELGRGLATHLVKKHKLQHLLLLSRKGSSTPGTENLVSHLLALGAETVEVVSCDITQPQELQQTLSNIPSHRPLRGVFHLAGVLESGLFATLPKKALERVLQPKVQGVWNLHHATKVLPLTHFVLFSSMAGILGSAGQTSYATANAFLDAFAVWRRQQGLPALSLAWGLWEQANKGMTAHLNKEDKELIRQQGMQPLTEKVGWKAMDRVLSGFRAPLLYAPSFVPLTATHPHLQLEKSSFSPDPATTQAPSPARTLAKGEKVLLDKQELEVILEEETARVLGISRRQLLGFQSFREMGLDSLTAVELQKRLSHRLGLSLASTLAFEYPTPKTMAEFLYSQLQPKPEVPLEWTEKEIRSHLEQLPIETLRQSGLLDFLMKQTDFVPQSTTTSKETLVQQLEETDDDEELLALMEDFLGESNES